MPEDLISLIIPVFNGKKHFNTCFGSIENQDYKNLEIIFIDNNSTDGSYDILKNYCLEKKNHILLKCKKKGPSAARNMGIKFSNGKYISFLDVDDLISFNKYSILHKVIENNSNCKIVFGDTRKKGENKKWRNNDYGEIDVGINNAPTTGILWLRQFQHQVHPGAILVCKSAAEQVGGFPENLFYGEDIAFMVKLGLRFDSFYVKQLIYTNNDVPTSITSTANLYMDMSERFLVFYKYFALDYFYKRKNIRSYNICYNIVEYDSFKILIRLIKYQKKYKYIKDLYSHSKYTQKNNILSLRFFFFKYFPFKIANFIFVKLLT
jgi:glycosyltransferase involved in cell wall biosynthesis